MAAIAYTRSASHQVSTSTRDLALVMDALLRDCGRTAAWVWMPSINILTPPFPHGKSLALTVQLSSAVKIVTVSASYKLLRFLLGQISSIIKTISVAWFFPISCQCYYKSYFHKAHHLNTHFWSSFTHCILRWLIKRCHELTCKMMSDSSDCCLTLRNQSHLESISFDAYKYQSNLILCTALLNLRKKYNCTGFYFQVYLNKKQ